MPELLDELPAIRGDTRLRGFRSRPEPTDLPEGIARFLENMRCDEQNRPRAGTVALATDLQLVATPAVLDFDLPTEVAVSSVTRAGATVTVTTATPHGFTTGNTVGLEGALPVDYNGDWVVTVTGPSTFTYNIGVATPTSPATGTIVCARGVRVFDVASDRVYAALVYVENDLTERVLIATGAKAYVYRAGLSTLPIAYPAGELIVDGDPCALEVYLNKIYLFRGRSAGPTLTVSSATRAGATVTVTTGSAHGLATGDWVRMLDQSDEAYRGVYQVTVTGGTTFTYNIGAPTPVSPAATPGTCFKVKPVLTWDRNPAGSFGYATTGTPPGVGRIRIPPADWALAFNRQLILPYDRDQIILSGFGVDDDFDTLLAQARVKPGSADWLVAAAAVARTRILLLYRRSLHLVQRSVSDLSISAVDEVPSGLGCVARRTVQPCGEFIAWLSDRGVELLRYVDQLNLVTDKAPLSAFIDDLIKRINWAYASRAVAAYLDNRLYLAVPMDGATVNNRVLVFNFLNRSADSPFGEWESFDSYPGDFDIADILVLAYNGRQSVHYITSLGGLYVAHQGDQDEYGAPGATLGTYDIPGVIRGRRHLFGTLDKKRVTKAQVSVSLVPGAQVQVVVSTRNPDSDRTVRDFTATAEEDRLINAAALRAQGESVAVDVVLPKGRPIVRAVTLKAGTPGSDSRDKE